MRENRDQKNSEYGHFSRSVSDMQKCSKDWFLLKDYWKILQNFCSGVFFTPKVPEKYSKKIHCTKMFVMSNAEFRENKLEIKELIFLKGFWKIFSQNFFLFCDYVLSDTNRV